MLNYCLTNHANLTSLVSPLSEREVFKFDQSKLNIEARSRRSRLPWRGQFSPELVDYIMDVVCPNSQTFLDPFCGSGTVLYEAFSKGKSAWGVEINPAAWHLAALSSFAGISYHEKKDVLAYIKNLIQVQGDNEPNLFASEYNPQKILTAINTEYSGTFLGRALAAIVLLGMGNNHELTNKAIINGASAVLTILNELINETSPTDCYIGDARQIMLSDEAIEAVITSPPYINVFNYHQNYRPAAELLGWLPLEAARSEIGANRKHRMNRFLTVVQYCLDMAQCIDELTRVMKTDAPLVIVLGRTSNVLGASFQNGSFIKKLLSLSEGFGTVQSAERVFTNRFGEKIYEDIFVAYRQKRSRINLDEARSIGVGGLISAKDVVSEKNREALEYAINNAEAVNPSPLLNITVPKAFKIREKEYASS